MLFMFYATILALNISGNRAVFLLNVYNGDTRVPTCEVPTRRELEGREAS